MIYLSQLIGVDIIDSKQDVIGRLKDVVVLNTEGKYPSLIGIVFVKNKKWLFISYKNIETLSPSEITLNSFNCFKPWEEMPNYMLLKRDLMDEQIFDVEGIRVVRINDLQLVKIGDVFNLVGIDISNKALIRRMGLSFLPFIKFLETNVIDWHNVNFIKGSLGTIKLKTPYKKLEKLHPADIANLIENLTLRQSSNVVQAIDEEVAAEILAEMDPKYKDILLEKINPVALVKILEEMPSDEAADVLQDLSEQRKKQVFKKLREKKANILNKLVKYKDDLAGGLMNTDFIYVEPQNTVEDAVDLIRKKSDEHKSIYHVFVIDKDQHLKGIVSIRTLLLADGHLKIGNIMSKPIVTVSTSTTEREIARLLTKYNLLSVAVTDNKKRLKGIVTVDDVMRLLVPDA